MYSYCNLEMNTKIKFFWIMFNEHKYKNLERLIKQCVKEVNYHVHQSTTEQAVNSASYIRKQWLAENSGEKVESEAPELFSLT